MKLDLTLMKVPLAEIGDLTVGLERAGFDGAWMTETTNDAFVSLAPAALATNRIELGTAIALAFVRSPMLTAYNAWELQRASRGRFILGLGTQVKTHNERRFSVPFASPVPKLAEQVRALRACWAAFSGQEPLAFRGEFYRMDFLPPMVTPEPIDHAPPPIHIAALNRYSCRVAGEVADGMIIHPFTSPQYLSEVALPALDEGLARSGRTRADFTVTAQVIAAAPTGRVTRPTPEAMARQLLAFYGSTRSYRPPLEVHGLGDLTERLAQLLSAGDLAALGKALPEEVVDNFAVVADTWDEVPALVRKRYEGLVDRVALVTPPPLQAGDVIAGLGPR
jgi:probable F420-dependent oxidoreductase